MAFARTLMAVAAICLPSAAAAAVRAELPVREVDLSDGARRYVVEIEIDGRQVEAGLDTGSTGLRVLPRALPVSALSARGDKVGYFYTSGTRFDGQEIRQPVSIGGIGGDVKLMRVDTLGCTREQPRCPVTHVDPAQFGIQGDGLPGQGFAAILGISLKSDSVSNPLEQLGITRWIVDLPTPGSSTPGRLILNPADAEIVGYKRLQIVGDGSQLAGCLVGSSRRASICGLTVFDTGAPGIRIVADHGIAPWPQGTPAEVAVGDSATRLTMPIQIGRRDQASAMFTVVRPGANPTRISFGLAPYFRWSVLYDSSAHEVGVRDR